MRRAGRAALRRGRRRLLARADGQLLAGIRHVPMCCRLPEAVRAVAPQRASAPLRRSHRSLHARRQQDAGRRVPRDSPPTQVLQGNLRKCHTFPGTLLL